jgi:hypothetical protein
LDDFFLLKILTVCMFSFDQRSLSMMVFDFEVGVGGQPMVVVGAVLSCMVLAGCDEKSQAVVEDAAQPDAMPGDDASASDSGKDAEASDGGDPSDSGPRDASRDGPSPLCTSQPDRPVRNCNCMDAGLAVVVACETEGEPTCYQYTDTCVDPGFTICWEALDEPESDLWAACDHFCREHRNEPWLSCGNFTVSDAGADPDAS